MIKFGLNVGQQQCTIDELLTCWTTVEQLGFEWLSVWDHFYPDNLPFSDPIFEGSALHAAVACHTTLPRLGSTVYCVAFRHPALIANAGVTIDHLSGGRLELGLGAGWHEAEFTAYGFEWERPAVRLRRLHESVEIIRALWTQPAVDFDGEFYQLREAFCSPKPVQTPPRIWLGTLGDKTGLRLAGELADGWNCSLQPVEEFRRKREIVLSHASAPDKLLTSVNVPYVQADDVSFDTELVRRFGPRSAQIHDLCLHGSAQRMVDMVMPYAEAGADWVILSIRAPFDLDSLATFANEVIPAVRANRAAPAPAQGAS